MDKYAIIVAGGSGMRMGGGIPKQFLMLHARPVLWYSITAFFTSFDHINIILVLPETFIEEGKLIVASTSSPESVEIIKGGPTRFHSVSNGLHKVQKNSVVFVHDGVRCLVTPDLIHRCYEATLRHGNAVPATSAVDTIRIETKDGNQMIDRSKVKFIQTPQTFTSDTLIKAYQQDYNESFTDDASVVETLGEKIVLIDGDATNIKITRKIDLLIAEQILADRVG